MAVVQELLSKGAPQSISKTHPAIRSQYMVAETVAQFLPIQIFYSKAILLVELSTSMVVMQIKEQLVPATLTLSEQTLVV
ncbi:hypothetical protein EFO31_01955 [Lactococcus lactis]|nr:hypothetical protein [Lactococcus lactis]